MQCKERARVELGRGGRSNGRGTDQHLHTVRGGRHCNRGDIDARCIMSEKAARVGKGQDELLVRCGLDEAAKKEENTAEGEPVQ
jgi:hypothetical protein